jgi:hypothetical protein
MTNIIFITFTPPQASNTKPPKLSKFAAAAGKKMRKLRRNWSLKKSDISRSLSKIRRSSLTGAPGAGGVGVVVGPGGTTEVRRMRKKVPRSRDGTLVNRSPSFKASSVVQSDEATMFYITLNIEDVNGASNIDDEAGNNAEEGSCEYLYFCVSVNV